MTIRWIAGDSYLTASTGIKGEWVILTSPDVFRLTHFQLVGQSGAADRSPKDYKIFGQGKDANWVLLSTSSGQELEQIISVANTGHFSTYGLEVTSLQGINCPAGNTLNFQRWNMWGEPCVVGAYPNEAGECTACPQGTYSTAKGRASCLSCPMGMTTAHRGCTSLKECFWKQLVEVQGIPLCVSTCAVGHYCSIQAQPGAIDVIANGGATGGYSKYENIDSVGSIYQVHNFTHVGGLQNSSGDFASTPYTIRISGNGVLVADVLVVGGGGGGGGGQTWGCGGAGGGGGVTLIMEHELPDASMIHLRVWAGGQASGFNTFTAGVTPPPAHLGQTGAASVFAENEEVLGGGGGGSIASISYDLTSQGSTAVTSGGTACAKSSIFTAALIGGGACVGSSMCSGLPNLDMAFCGGGGGWGVVQPTSQTLMIAVRLYRGVWVDPV